MISSPYSPERPPKPVAGCLECSGMTPKWRGKAARENARLHAEETGHEVWTGEQERPPRKGPAETAPKPRKPRLDNPPPIPKERLSKRAMCDGKVAHRSPAAAQIAVEKTRGNREFLGFYQSLYCGKYHVGHVIKPGRPQ